MDEAWRTVTIPEETYVRLKAAAVNLAEAVARAERAEQKAAPAPAATAETGAAPQRFDGLDGCTPAPHWWWLGFETREQAESAAAKLADYDKLMGDDNVTAAILALSAALQKPEGEPQTESE